MAFVGLAASRQVIINIGDTKFCIGEDCKKEKPMADFPKSGGRYCKKCAAKNQNERYHNKRNDPFLSF